MRIGWALALAACTPAPLLAQLPGSVPIRRWAVLAAFPSDTAAAGLDHETIPNEAALDPAAGPQRGVAWRIATADEAGRVDLLRLLGRPAIDRHVAYAVAYLSTPGARTADLGVESDDDVAVWLNGIRIHRHVVTRAVRMETDTVTVRLRAGVNRLVYKIVNRDGGFGFGGRVLGSSPDPIAGIIVPATRAGASAPAPAGAAVTIGPIAMPERAVLDADGELVAPIRVRVTRWGAAAAASVSVGTVRRAVPARAQGDAIDIELPVRWDELARLLGAGALHAHGEVPGGAPADRLISLARDPLLDALSRPLTSRGWVVDSSAGRLALTWRVPTTLGGLPLALEAAEFSAGAEITINGRRAAPGPTGDVGLCDPCAAGDTVRIVIATRGTRWWDTPAIRVATPGWREIREGARWAARFAPAIRTGQPGAATADSLLAASADPSKRLYRAIVEGWMRRLAPAAAHARRDTISVVGNSHLDVVWLWDLADGIEVLRNTWRTATKLLAKYPRMHFAGSAAYYYTILEREEPALLATIQRLVAEGRWNLVGGWWIEPDANMPSGESLVRQGLYGQRTLRRLFGRTARVAWTPDTFGYPWTLPQILLGSGLDGFVTQKLRWNDRNAWPAALDGFWWEGPDGSRVLSYVPYGYDHDLDPERLAAELDSTISGGKMRAMLTLYGVGDHGGGPTIGMLERARDLQRVPTFPVLADASPDSALDRMRRVVPALPTVRDELYLEYHRGAFTTNGAMKWWNRHLESLLGAAEAAATLAPLPYPRAQLTRAWEMTLFNQMHDVLPGTSIRAVHVQAEADYMTADSLARRVFERSVRALAAGADTRAPRAGLHPYIVFNPTVVRRGGRVTVRLTAGEGAAFDSSGSPLPARMVMDSAGRLLEVVVPEVPGLGAALIFLGPGALAAVRDTAGSTLENRWLRVDVDPATGDIARVYDKLHRREVLRGGSNTLTMLEDRPGSWDAWNINHLHGRRLTFGRARVGVVQVDAAGRSLVVSRERDSVRVEQRYVLPGEVARLDIETTVDWHTRHELLKVAFVLATPTDSVVAEIPYGAIARPSVARTAVDSARFEVPMQRWVDASAGGYGVAIVNDSKYAYDVLGDTVRLSLLRAPMVPDAVSDQRRHHFTLSLVPHAGDWRDASVRAAAAELNDPLRAVKVDEHAGGRLAEAPFTLTGAGVAIGAVKRSEDGDATVLRIVETAGQASRAVLRFRTPAVTRAASMLEDAIGPATAPALQLDLQLRPWEIRTLLVTLPRP